MKRSIIGLTEAISVLESTYCSQFSFECNGIGMVGESTIGRRKNEFQLRSITLLYVILLVCRLETEVPMVALN